jgi:hypothetical protein
VEYHLIFLKIRLREGGVMNLKMASKLLVLGAAFFCVASLGYAAVVIIDEGLWPETWPKELEPLRKRSKTIRMIGEDIYEIPFGGRDLFEALWPVFLSLKTPEAPLRLTRVKPEEKSSLLSHGHPLVRIYAPSRSGRVGPGGEEGEAMGKLFEAMRKASPEKRKELEQEIVVMHRKQDEQGKSLRPGPPWPKELISDGGALPEYVSSTMVDGKMRWVRAKRDEKPVGFLYRVRIEIELVVDGEVIDLNRIPIPPDTAVIDTRFDGRPKKK